jgi:hypothetical protein
MLRRMQAERAEISEHMVRIWRWLSDRESWETSASIAIGAGVSGRTARAHAHRLVGLGLLDQAEVFPGHRYRVSKLAEKRNKAFVLRLQEAASVFGDK